MTATNPMKNTIINIATPDVVSLIAAPPSMPSIVWYTVRNGCSGPATVLTNENSSLDGELIAKQSEQPSMVIPRMVKKGAISVTITCKGKKEGCSFQNRTLTHSCSYTALICGVCI